MAPAAEPDATGSRFAKPVRRSVAAAEAPDRLAPQAPRLAAEAPTAQLTSTTSRVTRDSVAPGLRWVAPSRARTTAVAARAPRATHEADPTPETEPAPEDLAGSEDLAADQPVSETSPEEPPTRSRVRAVVAHERPDDRGAARRAFASGDRAFASGDRAQADDTVYEEASADPFDDPFEDGTELGSRPVQRTVARIVDPSSGEEVVGGEPTLAVLEQAEDELPPGMSEADETEPETEAESGTESIRDALPPREDDMPTLEEEVAQGPLPEEEPCPSPKDLKRIGEITDDITPDGTEFPQECSLGDEMFQPREWAMTTFHWKASGLCYKPLYFQQVPVERYGHTWPLIQPIVSGANFFLTFPVLPYKMGLNPPWECMYPLGYYRPGSCAPYMIGAVPISVRAGLLEAGAWVGGVYLIP